MNDGKRNLRRMSSLPEVKAYLNEVRDAMRINDQVVFEAPEKLVGEVVKAVMGVELSVIDIYEGSKGYLVFVVEKRF
ncbi:MAG: hypothetical protein B7O98_00660 [Zestosphaera tikiterensis]|uniref:Uncharacterized protein n=1 Tax=Zestosphaera tikiterensis TaxID=1973259 RepID=A0A2R7YAS0_9CREN|nr:MAG: hypothetical protein B7O98_00660 [Zestosphaera tikiterensis]